MAISISLTQWGYSGVIHATLPTHQNRSSISAVFIGLRPPKLELLARDIPFPNGLAFSPDDKRLYVSSSAPRKEWMVYDVNPDGGIQNGRVFFDVTNEPGQNVPDGMKIDQEGNLYASGPGGLWLISSDAKHLGTIRVPGGVSNCAFGETDGRTLFFTTSTSVYRLRLKIGGRAP